MSGDLLATIAVRIGTLHMGTASLRIFSGVVQYRHMKSTKEQYEELKKEAGKDALKAMAFFFLGLPLTFTIIVWLAVM